MPLNPRQLFPYQSAVRIYPNDFAKPQNHDTTFRNIVFSELVYPNDFPKPQNHLKSNNDDTTFRNIVFPELVNRQEGHFSESEANGANSGLVVARDLLEPIKNGVAKDMSHADLWALAACVAVKVMGGPDVPFRAGRKDADTVEARVEEGRRPRLPQDGRGKSRRLGRQGDKRVLGSRPVSHVLDKPIWKRSRRAGVILGLGPRTFLEQR